MNYNEVWAPVTQMKTSGNDLQESAVFAYVTQQYFRNKYCHKEDPSNGLQIEHASSTQGVQQLTLRPRVL
jgi:hypothetical protein